jgi:glutaredoxin 3
MATEEYLSRAKDLISKHQFLMLSKSWCPDCHYVYKVWDEYNVGSKVHIIELDKFEDQDDAVKLEQAFTEISGRKWVPTLFFNGKRFGTEQDLKALKENGKLTQVFKGEKLID